MVLQNEKTRQAGRCRMASLTIAPYCHYRVSHPIEPSQCPLWVKRRVLNEALRRA